MAEHAEAIQRAFTQQAPAFEDPEFNRLFTVESDWLFDRLELLPTDIVLDVAAGTGHVARRFAPQVRSVVAVDATKAMLDRGWIEAKRAALRNVVFMQADAAALPFVDGSFDVVVSRFALHHFEDPTVQIAEMRRVLRPGGRLAVADLSATPTRRSPRPRTTWSGCATPRTRGCCRSTSWPSLVGGSDVEFRDTERSLEPWLAQTQTRRRSRRRSAPRCAPTSRAARRPDSGRATCSGDPRFLHTMASVIAAGTLLPGP